MIVDMKDGVPIAGVDVVGSLIARLWDRLNAINLAGATYPKRCG